MPTVKPCIDAVGFDCATKLTATSAKALRSMGFLFAIQYVGLHQPDAGDLDPATVETVMQEIGALWVVQHVRLPGWSPSGQLGRTDGTAAARNALAAGYLPGAVLWQDLEGVAAGTPPQAVIDYTCEWGETIIAEGFLHGLYNGYDTVLSPDQLYHALPTVKSYWSDFASRTLPIRGFALKQVCNSLTIPSVGFPIDIDICHADLTGSRPAWMSAA